jgi:hypothetical protein
METKINGSTQPNFVPIPIATLKDTKLSLQAKGLLLFLYTVEQINKTDLANNLKIDPPQLDLLLNELVENRYLFLGDGEYFLSFFGSFKVLENYEKYILTSPHTPLPPHNIMDIILGKVEDTLVRKKTKKGGENQINLSTIDERERKFKEKLVKYCIGYGGTYEERRMGRCYLKLKKFLMWRRNLRIGNLAISANLKTANQITQGR